MKKKIINIILVILALTVFPVISKAQEKTAISPYVQISYLKNSEGQRILQTSLTYSQNRMELPLPGMEISFYTGAGNSELLTTVTTDAKGIARYEIPAEKKLATGSDGTWAFSSEFRGNDSIEAGTSEVTIKDVRLEMTLALADSIKTVTVNAFTTVKGVEKPVADETVKILVPRMFSNLTIGELTLDETGTASVEFPADLPGDKDGHLTIIAKFEENAAFGNVEKSETLAWGVKTDYSVPTTHRALWTKTAPKWMIYTLSVLLAGVWGHYMFALISLIRIARDAKRKERDEYRI